MSPIRKGEKNALPLIVFLLLFPLRVLLSHGATASVALP